jgi:signal transduction histidine kinase
MARPEQELARTKERLRSMAMELLLSEERERRRLAVDLHDGLSQLIALAQMKLAALARSGVSGAEKPIEEIRQVIDQANRSVRSITFQLSPPVLHDIGLEPALQWLAEDLRQRYRLPVTYEDDGQKKPLEDRLRVVMFRSVRELLINAAKHAAASAVRVRSSREGNFVCVSVEDDGVGMDVEHARAKGSGLFNIHERLGLLGGSVTIETAPGKGTKIRLRAPLLRSKPGTKARVRRLASGSCSLTTTR